MTRQDTMMAVIIKIKHRGVMISLIEAAVQCISIMPVYIQEEKSQYARQQRTQFTKRQRVHTMEEGIYIRKGKGSVAFRVFFKVSFRDKVQLAKWISSIQSLRLQRKVFFKASCTMKSKEDVDMGLKIISLFLKPLKEYSCRLQDASSSDLIAATEVNLRSLREYNLSKSQTLPNKQSIMDFLLKNSAQSTLRKTQNEQQRYDY
ncbi:hypothetical protein C7M84_000059 [Penaeus vannamei]|uniref:Uncharacterized protein n=1 Tax=Penaeus vannamei TaxID=6689 RepID=A0A3R7PYN1_PENVA|nr:hypothetical protein C7M84_000059 [Penaeus vannamei]